MSQTQSSGLQPIFPSRRMGVVIVAVVVALYVSVLVALLLVLFSSVMRWLGF